MRKMKLSTVPFVPVVALLFGAVTVILILMTPLWLFERGVVVSGLPALLPAAQPPLGQTARILSAVAAGLGVAALLWGLLYILRAFIKRKAPPKARGMRIEATKPFVTKGAATFDTGIAPLSRKREPIFAERDLGAPFMSDEAIASPTFKPLPATPIEPEVFLPAVEQQPVPDAALLASELREAPAVLPFVAGSETIAGLMARLDAALERRSAQGVLQNPVPIGDIASLRKALGALG